MSARLQRLCAWCGPALIILFVIGFILLARLMPVITPSASAEEVAALYQHNTNAIRLGVLIAMLGWTLIGPWGISIAVQAPQHTKGARAMAYLQIASCGSAIAVVVITLLLYGLAAFRPDTLAPDTTRMLNDFAWFMFLFSWPPFSLWMVTIGLSILADDRKAPTFPRWAAYLNFWVALLIAPAGMIIFFKSGPLAFNGVIALYLPLVLFFIWICTMTSLVLKVVTREEAESSDDDESVPSEIGVSA